MTHHRPIIFFRFSGIGLPDSAGTLRRGEQPTAYSLSSGVTLIELLMVMVIMAIIMAISVPAFNSMGRGSDMRGAVSSVRNTIAQSRQWAITHREPVTFRYGSPSIRTNPAYYYVTNSAGLYLQDSNTLPLSIRFQNDGACTFKSDGSLAGGAISTNIVLVSSNAQREIEINALTGGIRVQ